MVNERNKVPALLGLIFQLRKKINKYSNAYIIIIACDSDTLGNQNNLLIEIMKEIIYFFIF